MFSQNDNVHCVYFDLLVMHAVSQKLKNMADYFLRINQKKKKKYIYGHF